MKLISKHETMYNGLKVLANDPIDVLERDIETLIAAGWIEDKPKESKQKKEIKKTTKKDNNK